jgi:hypothetical protein
MADATRDWLNTWENSRAEVDEYRQVDSERVLVLVTSTGRGKVSGLEIVHLEPRGAQVFHLRNGRVTRFVQYLSRDRALADLGLEA